MNSEAKNMASVTVSKQLGMSRIQNTWITLDEQQQQSSYLVAFVVRFVPELKTFFFSQL